MSVRLKKNVMQLSHAMVKTISSRSPSRVPEKVDDQGMRDRKAVHTIRDSCYHQ